MILIGRQFLKIGACLLAFGASMAEAADYPAAPIKVIVPYPAGGLVDIVMRVVSQRMAAELHQPVVVESKVGAGGTIASTFVARADPDGYTLLAITDSHTTNPLAFSNLPYDSIADFSPIGLIGGAPLVLAVNNSVPARTVKEFVALANENKERPLTYGSLGVGSAAHLAGEVFKIRASVDLLHVPYKGGAPAVNDLVAGHIKSMFLTPIVSMPHVQSGSIMLLAIAAKTRFPLLPDVPTMQEAGYPMEAGYWVGLVAPAKTPANIIAVLDESLHQALADEGLRQRLTDIGLLVSYKDSKEFGGYIAGEMKYWKEFVSSNRIKMN